MIPHDIIAGILFVSGIVSVLIVSEILHRKFAVTADTTRKLVHITVGLMAASSPWIFINPPVPLLIGSMFIIGNYWLLKRDRIVSIHRHDRQNYGTVFFPLAFVILIGLYWYKHHIYISGLLMMSISDPMAGSLGKRIKHPLSYTIWGEQKTVEGSVVMFLSAFLITAAVLFYTSQTQQLLYPLHSGVIFGLAGLVALMATMAEATSRNGSDNLSVPLLSALMLDLLIIQWNHGYFYPLLIWIFLSAIVFYIIMRSGWLSPDGTVGAWIMGVFIVGSQSWVWIIYLFSFLISGTLLSRQHGRENNHFQSSESRSIVQVYANGALPLIIALSAFYLQSEKGIFLYLAAIAAATADTWATELGLRSKRPPRNLITLKPVLPGQSGGVTVQGLLGSLLGAIFIAALSLIITRDPRILGIIVIAGFTGALFDSALGATIQAQYRCSRCSQPTEHSSHCGIGAEKVSGWSWIGNNTVNFINTVTGALVLYFLL